MRALVAFDIHEVMLFPVAVKYRYENLKERHEQYPVLDEQQKSEGLHNHSHIVLGPSKGVMMVAQEDKDN